MTTQPLAQIRQFPQRSWGLFNQFQDTMRVPKQNNNIATALLMQRTQTFSRMDKACSSWSLRSFLRRWWAP